MKLIHSPDPWLEKKVKPFDFETLDPVEISKQMTSIMLENDGIGLSANQVGLDAQIFVIKPLCMQDNTPFAVINPVIKSTSESQETLREGCLSHPNLALAVVRPSSLVAEFLDIHAQTCIIEFKGIDARCFLHEYDHLQGIEFTDRVSRVKLAMALKKQQKLHKRMTQNG